MRIREPEDRDAAKATTAERREPPQPLLMLQQSSGNAAVARLVDRLAREAKGKPAAKPTHKKYSLTTQEEAWDRPTLLGHGGDVYDQKAFDHAAALYEKAYELQADRGLALNIYRCYHQLGWDEEAEHWLGISQGRKAESENAPPVSYQQF
jgi:hypothetical protein